MVWPFVNEKYEAVDFAKAFENINPVELEIGCGRGKFLVTRAEHNPNINFLGIDRISHFMKVGQKRAEKLALKNIRFLRAEAKSFLTDAIASSTVSVFHLYFSDPWPKRRHQTRRVFTPELLKLFYDKLTANGLVEIATDDVEYFQTMRKVVSQTADLWESVKETINERIFDFKNKTSYEIKWAQEGRALFYMEMKKK